ncbi:MAG: thioredoxin family protein [Flavipsychrobacter sp.]|jgi:thioredoxin-related protein|nr:thioredoxin family protein [Flavipsychrobacter sp.]
MKKLITTISIIVMSMTYAGAADWGKDLEKAKEKAKSEHKYILLNFSGLDWCTPCMRTKKEIFDKDVFKAYAEENLVLVNADFPRLKKNYLPEDQTKKNNALAAQYDKKGLFPLTLLLSPDGTVLKEWVGYPGMEAQQFVEEIKVAKR